MLDQFTKTYQRLTALAQRSGRVQRSASLEICVLEERATPAADLLQSVEPPVSLNVVELPPSPELLGLAPVKAIVRLDFVAGTQSPKQEGQLDWEEWISQLEGTDAETLFAHHEETDDAETQTPAPDEINLDELALTEEEIAELMVARPE